MSRATSPPLNAAWLALSVCQAPGRRRQETVSDRMTHEAVCGAVGLARPTGTGTDIIVGLKDCQHSQAVRMLASRVPRNGFPRLTCRK